MLRVSLLFLFIFTSLFAEDIEEFPFLGVTVATQSIDIKNAKNEKETTFGIRYGKQTVDWRTMFSYEFGSNGYQMIAMEIDKILMDDLMGMPEFRPYLGLTVGGLQYDSDNLNESKGYFYGLNAGLIIYATDKMDADISYHYYDVKNFDEMDKIKGGTFSLHYFY